MIPLSMKLLSLYQYDPLDRLTGVGLLQRAVTQRFYHGSHLMTEVGDQTHQTIVRHDAQPLAQRQTLAGIAETALLATDRADSVLQSLTATNREQIAYTAYGHRPARSGLGTLLGFNGECPDAMTGHYLLGQGTRAFNPALMRFNSPDELSPFGDGGLNSYAYCEGDPINFIDPTGSIRLSMLTNWRAPRSSVIVKNPLHKIKPSTSSINRNRQIHNPILNDLLDKTPSISLSNDRSYSALPFNHALKPTPTPRKLLTKPSPRTRYRRVQIDYGIKYDDLKKSQQIQTVATPDLQNKFDHYTSKINSFDFSGDRRKLYQLSQSLNDTELAIKKQSVQQHENMQSQQNQIRSD